MYIDRTYLIYLLAIIVLTLIPQLWVNLAYSRNAKRRISSNKSGVDVVNEMLAKNDIYDVRITRIAGTLTDHYDSKRKIIALSGDNFDRASVASVAVAAHETGHALQDAKGYALLRLRQGLGPATVVASRLSWIIIYLGFIFIRASAIPLIIGISLFAVLVLFDLVTLPVEVNASRRAMSYLKESGNFTKDELNGARHVLIAAASTYLAVTLAGILQLLRLLSILNNRRN